MPNPMVNDESEDAQKEGTALCLSGGGYRAMLFHLGSLWRLNDAGLLPRLSRISTRARRLSRIQSPEMMMHEADVTPRLP